MFLLPSNRALSLPPYTLLLSVAQSCSSAGMSRLDNLHVGIREFHFCGPAVPPPLHQKWVLFFEDAFVGLRDVAIGEPGPRTLVMPVPAEPAARDADAAAPRGAADDAGGARDVPTRAAEDPASACGAPAGGPRGDAGLRPLRVLFMHGLESGPLGSKAQYLSGRFQAVETPDMQMSLWRIDRRNSLTRSLLRTVVSGLWPSQWVAGAMTESLAGCLEVQRAAVADFRPDVVVGSSWGGGRRAAGVRDRRVAGPDAAPGPGAEAGGGPRRPADAGGVRVGPRVRRRRAVRRGTEPAGDPGGRGRHGAGGGRAGARPADGG